MGALQFPSLASSANSPLSVILEDLPEGLKALSPEGEQPAVGKYELVRALGRGGR